MSEEVRFEWFEWIVKSLVWMKDWEFSLTKNLENLVWMKVESFIWVKKLGFSLKY